MSANAPEHTVAHALFAGEGLMRERCRSRDWTRTPLGDVSAWPVSLRTTAQTVLGSGFPMVLLWGPALVQIFNDHYLPFLGEKHERALGQPTRECWPEVWHINAPIYERVLSGETVTLEEAHFPVQRNGSTGAVEDLYITLSYSPVPDDEGSIGGVLITLLDATANVVGRAVQAERDVLEAQLYGAMHEATFVLDQTRDAYVLMDAELRIRTANSAAERFLHGARGDLVGRTYEDAFPASFDAEPETQLRRVAAQRVEAHFVHHVVGEQHDVHLEFDAYPASDGGAAVFWRDVSERVRLEAAAKAARHDAETRAATLEAIIHSIPDALLVARRDGVFLANDAALKVLGVPGVTAATTGLLNAMIPFEELLRDRATGAALPLDATPIGRAFNGARSHGQFLLQVRGGGDALRPVRAAAAPILSSTGDVTGVVTVFTDMSSVLRAEAERDELLTELEAERTLLRTVLEQLPAAVFVVEAPSGRVLALNSAVARIWGGPRPLTEAIEQYSGQWVGYHVDGRRIESAEWPVARAARGETITDWRGEIERADGERVLIEVSAVPVHNAAGETVAAVAVAIDITARAAVARERERLLHALDVERSRLAYAFQRAPTFLAIVRGPTHVFEFVNDAYYQLVGRRDLLGKSVADALPEVREQGFVELIDEVLATGDPFVGREVPIHLARMLGGEEEARFVDFVYLPLVEADGTRSGIIAHGTDVTEQVEARKEIERLLRESEQARADAEVARVEAEAANRGKSEFLAVMSHELRTPLNAIGGYAELIAMGVRGPVTDAQRSDLERIQISQAHLLSLINHVLNYAMLDAGAVPFELADVSLDEMLMTCEALITPQAAAKRIALAFHDCDTQLRARADEEKVRQVVLNLLSNALKFTDPGGSVSLSCATVSADSGTGQRIAVHVTDTGRGIAPEQLERVFQPFVQVDARLTRAQEGTGLGLAISRDLARGMGGDLTVKSTLGAGSTFTLLLPAA